MSTFLKHTRRRWWWSHHNLHIPKLLRIPASPPKPAPKATSKKMSSQVWTVLPSTPLHSTTTIPHNASLNCCDNLLALNSRAVTPTPPELTSTQQQQLSFTQSSPPEGAAVDPPAFHRGWSTTSPRQKHAQQLPTTWLENSPLQIQKPQICPPKVAPWDTHSAVWTRGGRGKMRRERARERIHRLARCLLRWAAPPRTRRDTEACGGGNCSGGGWSSGVEWSRLVSWVGDENAGECERKQEEGGSERRRRPGWRSWDECMHARSGVGVNKCYFLSQLN